MSHCPLTRLLAGLALPLGMAALSHPSTSHAEQVSPTSSAPSTPGASATTATSPDASPTRLRLGLGAYGGFWGSGLGGGLYARVGSQFTERLGLDVQFAVVAPFGWGVRGAVTAEFVATDWFAVGTGVSLVHLTPPDFSGLGGSRGSTILFAGVPLRIAFRIGSRATSGDRSAFEILTEGDVGVGSRFWPAGSACGGLFCSSSAMWPAGSQLAFGWAVWLGLGYARF